MIRNFGATGIVNQTQGIDLGLGGGSNIKSIQRGEVTQVGSSTDVTISAVDLTKAVLYITTRANAITYAPDSAAVKGKITTATNLNFSTYSATPHVVISWVVVEYENVKSLQKGDVVGIGPTVNISAVDITKSLIIHSARVNYATNDSTAMITSSKFNSATQISLQNVNFSCDYHWQVIEFN